MSFFVKESHTPGGCSSQFYWLVGGSAGNGLIGSDAAAAAADNADYKIRVFPCGNKNWIQNLCLFQVFSCTNVKFKAELSVFNTRSEEVTGMPVSVHTLDGYIECIRRDLLISHIMPQDEIRLVLNLTIESDPITKNSQNTINQLSKNLEMMFGQKKLSDFKIICLGPTKEKLEISVHKVVLAARSPVFSAMHTEEAQKSEVFYDDIDYSVMHEMLFYMYSGRSPLLKQMAFDLLAVADRFQLIGLKEMADQVLRSKLSTENVCRNLVFADKHNAFGLKSDAFQLILKKFYKVILTEGWAMMRTNPRLGNAVIAAMLQEQ